MSIKKVADIAGVSIATVSRYFNNPEKVSRQSRERVKLAVDELGYQPNIIARNLRRGNTGSITAIVDKFSCGFHSLVLDELSRLAQELGYNLSIQSNPGQTLSLQSYRQMLQSKQTDGFIVFTGLGAGQETLNNADSLPIVLACESLVNDKPQALPSVNIDHYSAAAEATRHLLDQGHTRLAFIGKTDDSPASVNLYRGFEETLRGRGIKPVSSSTVEAIVDLEGELDQLLSEDMAPTALLCGSAGAAMRSLQEVTARGLSVPGDISVMGFNSLSFGRDTVPTLCTIDISPEEVAQQSLDILMGMIHKESPESVVIPFNLVQRGSTGSA